MKTVTALMAAALLSLLVGSMGCEVSHSESDKPGWFGGNKHEETTVTKNPVTGDEHVEHSQSRTNP
jgi:hypothetical protein